MTRQNGAAGRDGAGPEEPEGTGARGGDAASGPPDTPEPLRSAPGFLVRRLYQAYAAAWLRHVDTALTGPQFAVMTAVAAYPRVDQGSLATCVALDRSTMADVCRRLEDRALIQRDTAPADGRRKLLSLTDQGESVLADVTRRVTRLNVRLMDGHVDGHADGPVNGQGDAGAEVEAGEFTSLIVTLDQLSERWERVADDDGV